MAGRVVVARAGASIRVIRGGLYVVDRDGSKVPVTADVDQVIVESGRVSVTAAAVRLAARMGVDIVFLDSRGRPAARLYPPVVNKTVEARVEQYRVLADPSRALPYAVEVVAAKIHNQYRVLAYLGKSWRERGLRDAADELAPLAALAGGAGDLDELRGLEARAARVYWGALASALPGSLGFAGRDQDAPDPFNAALNYGYGILYYTVEAALALAGLDPYLGFMHAWKSGRPSLALDVMEPFRPVAVDKPLATAARRGSVRLSQAPSGLLDYESRGDVSRVVLEGLRARYRSRKRPRPRTLEDHVRLEAYDLAASLRGSGAFEAFRVVL